ncbi:uncharacterized protein LOC112524526 isoform X2 [Cynara cardunculus var. scolymus]|uniref:uncharacterized protein LOC112524526 isoform X2 n=1 Tax=Cynara cardunculus var. scolymus TaxID=59895 RepID=UPI000D624024|nr:uncharacterized protein LOC112524526 isoform X2 [Cynara cardunculus var. scolymus]
MAGYAAFESASASSSELGFSGTYLNGQRGVRAVAVRPNLDRWGNLREGSESKMFGSGFAVSRGGNSGVVASDDLRTLSQCMSLEPIEMGDHKIAWYVELRRVMGISVGSTAEENSFGAAAAHMKPSPPVAVVKDLKRFRLSVVDTCVKARDRANKMDEHLHNLDKYCEAVSSTKQQSNELVINDRPGALNLKIGTQIYNINQRVEDRPKNILLNKRVRTSVAESRAECQSNGLQRQPVAMAKDGNLLENNGGESDLFDKIRMLAAGGEGWDKKMKRKRSVGTVFTRNDSDGVPKRATQNKVVDERGSQPSDAPICRLGASNGTGGNNKPNTTSLPNSSITGLSPKGEQGVPILPSTLTAGSNKERIITKENSKLNIRDGFYTTFPSPVAKSKASRTARTGSMVAASSSRGIPYVPGTLGSWQNATDEDKILSNDGNNNRKRAMPLGSSSAPMAQWVGQRPQKMSRARRANLVSPVTNQDEKHLSFESCSPSDVGARLVSNVTNGSPISRNATSGPPKLMVKLDNVQSPLRLSESEESVGGESRLKDKEMEISEADAIVVQNTGSSVTLAKKKKPLINEESGNGVWRQGRSGRGPLIARSSNSPMGNRLDNAATPKPLQRSKTGCKKNGSKPGRRLKRLSDRKGFSHHVPLHNSSSPECTGGSDDDREELLAAANHARIAGHLACSSTFWKKMDPLFASVSSEDKSFISHQLKCSQEIREGAPQLLGHVNNAKVGLLNEEDSVSDAFPSGEREVHMQHQGSESFSGRDDMDKTSNGFMPLYQRVLSALIIEDDIDGLEEGEARNIQVQNAYGASTYDSHHLGGSEPREGARMENECDTMFCNRAQSLHSTNKSFPSNGGINSFRSCTINSPVSEDGHSEAELLAGIPKSFLKKSPRTLQMEGLGKISLGCQYEQMCLDDKLLLELQSIGLCPDTLPDLDDKENGTILHEVDKLKNRLQQQEVEKKACLEKISRDVESNSGVRDLETLAMDRLAEQAYRKLLATRRTSRSNVHKVPKQVALAFGRRTLARCRKFENSGTSCFNEPPFQDILFAPVETEPEPTASVGWPIASTKYSRSRNSQPEPKHLADGGPSNIFGNFNHLSDEVFAINGPISNRGKKKELSLDDVGTAAIRAGTKGKRSERDTTKSRRGSKPKPKPRPKPKPKPKQKMAQLPITSGNNETKGPIHPVQPSANGKRQLADSRRDVRFASQGRNDTTNLLADDLDPLDELTVGAPQDLTSFLNFEEQDLEEDFAAGLDIPMDDLTQLDMF